MEKKRKKRWREVVEKEGEGRAGAVCGWMGVCCFLRVEGSVCQAGATSNLLRLSEAPMALVVTYFVAANMPSFGRNSTLKGREPTNLPTSL